MEEIFRKRDKCTLTEYPESINQVNLDALFLLSVLQVEDKIRNYGALLQQSIGRISVDRNLLSLIAGVIYRRHFFTFVALLKIE